MLRYLKIPSTNITRTFGEYATSIREFVVSFVDGLFDLPQRFLRLGITVHEFFTNARIRPTPIREFVASFVDGFLNLPHRFLRGLQIGMTQARVNLDGAAG